MNFPDGLLAVVYDLPWGKLRVVGPGAEISAGAIDEMSVEYAEGFCYAMEQCATVEQKKTLYDGMVKSGLIRPAVKPVDPNLKAFCDLLRAHDWTFEMSDDGRAYNKGKTEQDNIKSRMQGHPDRKALYDQYVLYAFRQGPKPVLPA